MTVAPDPWNVAQYERFKTERSKPFFDLMAMVAPTPGMTVVDLGCGTGELTAHLHRTLGALETLGIDSSPAMLAKAAEFSGGGLSFELGHIANLSHERRYDLVFSNAALQWLPDQRAAISDVANLVATGGQLAIQVPANGDSLSHTLAVEIAAAAPFAVPTTEQLGALPAEEYVVLLHRHGFAEIDVRTQVYVHYLESREAVFEWMKGTMLTRYVKVLDRGRYHQFELEYRHRLTERLPDEKPFLFPFKRILMHAVKRGDR